MSDNEISRYPEDSRGFNNFTTDINLQRYLRRHYADMLDRQEDTLESFGAFCSNKLDAQAEYSDRVHPPVLKHKLDRTVAPSKRVGRVELNEQYKDCQQEIYRHGMIAKCFDPQQPEPQMLAFLAQYMTSYTDISTGCPLAMTHPDALILASRAPANVRDKFLPQFLRTDGKTMVGATWATEWAGGSDVRGNTRTTAKLVDTENSVVSLDGQNFFTSAMGFESWGAIKTVRMKQGEDEGIALIFVTRFLDENWEDATEDRHENNISAEHIKEKSGTKGLATAEVAMDRAVGHVVAGPKDGLRVMMEALGCSRVHNAMAATGVMHRAYVEAMCWAQNRKAFGNTIDQYEDLQEDLLKLKTEWLGGAALAFEAARSFDATLADKKKAPWLRVATALAKFRTAEQATQSTALATEIVGGIGYTHDHPIERIHRDAMVLRVWEGPKNIQAKELAYILRHGGVEAFQERVAGIINELPADEMGMEKSRLEYLARKADDTLSEWKLCPEKDQLVAQRLMKDMAHMLTYALLCEEAGQEIAQDNDKTKQLIARSFYEDHYRTERKTLLSKTDLHRHFNDVAAERPVPVRENDAEHEPAPRPSESPRPQ